MGIFDIYMVGNLIYTECLTKAIGLESDPMK